MLEVIYTFILTTLTTYAVATLVSEYDGMFNLFVCIRKLGKVFQCSVCLGFWVAIIIGLMLQLRPIEIGAIIGLNTLLCTMKT